MGKMSKRTAQSDLNHDNWNQEEEPEEAGKFAQASEDELKKRVIKTARRRVTGADSGAGSGSGTAFSGFKGFSAVTSTPAATAVAKPTAGASPFSFLSNIAKPTNGTASATTTAASPAAASSISSATTSALGASIFASTDPNKKIFSGFGSPPKALLGSGGSSEKKGEAGDAKADEYAASIKALNQSVADWISDKVKENPLCKLTPIFKDYEKHLSEIEAKKDKVDSKELEAKATPTSAAKSGFTFGNVSPAAPAATTTAPAKTFSFGIGTSPTATPSTGFTFANVVKPTEEKSKAKEDADADEDEPPKVEFTPVEEKDSLYSKRY